MVPDKSMLQLHAEGARNALRDAGLTLKDVDGLFTANIPPTEVGEYLGIEPKVVDGTNVGGCSFLIHVAHAAAAIADGRCEVALITHGESGRSRVGMPPRAVERPDDARAVRGAVRAAPAGRVTAIASAAADALSGASMRNTPSNSPKAYQKPKSLPPSDSATSRAAALLSSGWLSSAFMASGV